MSEHCLKFVTLYDDRRRPEYDGHAEYIRGRNTRMESRSYSGDQYGRMRAYIQNRDIGYGFEIEPETRIFTACRANERVSPLWPKGRRWKVPARSGIPVHVHTQTIDTGERKTMFGCAARRVIVRSRSVRESELQNESESDGWFIDPPQAWASLHPVRRGSHCVLVGGNGPRDDYKFTDEGAPESGFILLLTTTSKWYRRSEFSENVSRREVVEFSEAGLPADLFVPPRDFIRVPQLPEGVRYGWPHRMRLRWEILRDSRRLPARIARFCS